MIDLTIKRILLVLVVSGAATTPVIGQVPDFRWTSNFGQGSFENIIQSRNGTVLNIYIPGSLNSDPEMFLTIKGKKLPGDVTVQFVVDAKNYPFNFQDGHFIAAGRMNSNDMTNFCRAMLRSRASSFVVEVPQARISDRLSLLNVRDVPLGCQ